MHVGESGEQKPTVIAGALSLPTKGDCPCTMAAGFCSAIGRQKHDHARNAWDGKTLQTMAKNSPLRATGAHVGIVGHITKTNGDNVFPSRARTFITCANSDSMISYRLGLAWASRSRSLGMQAMTGQTQDGYSTRQGAYDLRKLRGKQLVAKPGRTRRYHVPGDAARTIAALLTVRDKVIAPLLAGISTPRRGRPPKDWTNIDRDYETLRLGMHTLFAHLGIATHAPAAA
jgi:hypothetical protein